MNPFLSPSLLSLQLAALRRKKALFLRLIQRYRQTRRRERNYYQKPVNAQRENRGEFMRIFGRSFTALTTRIAGWHFVLKLL